jgi:hypothetical protein
MFLPFDAAPQLSAYETKPPFASPGSLPAANPKAAIPRNTEV